MRSRSRLLLVLLAVALGAWILLSDDGPVGDSGLEDSTYLDDPHGDGELLAEEDGPRAEPGTGAGPATTDPRGKGVVAPLPGRIEGSVLDSRRRPVAGATVQMVEHGRVRASATSDAAGMYAFEVPSVLGARGLNLGVLARRKGYGAAAAHVWIGTGMGLQRVPPIVLSTAHALRVRVTVDGAGALGATISVLRRRIGQLLPFAVQAAGAEGRARVEGLSAGLYEVFATRPGRGRTRVLVRVPQAATEEVELALGGERSLDVLVIDDVTERPVEGATVLVGDSQTLPEPMGPGYQPPLPTYVTDRSGRATARGLGVDETIHVNARAGGYLPGNWYRSRGQVAAPGVSEVVVRLRRHRSVVFPVFDGDTPAPPDGTMFRVQLTVGVPGVESPVTARMDGAYLVVEGLEHHAVQGTAIAADGAQGRFTAPSGADQGDAVTFRRASTLRVRVREPEGDVVAGLDLQIRSLDGGAAVEPVTTGPDGIAVFENVVGSRVSVHVRQADRPWGGPMIGRVELGPEDEIHELELASKTRVRIRVTVEGEARLPPLYTLTAAGQPLSSSDIVEDARGGTLDVVLRLPTSQAPVPLLFTATGFLPVSLTLDASRGDEHELDVDLHASGRLVARILLPTEGGFALRLERRDPASGAWAPATSGTGVGSGHPNDGLRIYEGLEAGSYRVVDGRSDAASAGVDVRLGAEAEVTLDLSGSTWITGKVSAPPGTNFQQARVLVEGRSDPSNVWAGERIGADGSFKVRAIRGAPVTLRVTHPTLTPARHGGTVTVTAGSKPVELRLERGAEVIFRVEGFESAQTPAGGVWRAPLKVFLFQGSLGEAPARVVQPVAAGGTFRFGGFAPGTYTLWFGFGTKYAPITRKAAALGAGTTDLGTLTPSTGETLRFDLRAGSGSAPSTVWATVTSSQGPQYARHANRREGDAPLEVSGLGAGRFDVVVRAAGVGGTRILLEASVSIDGKGETVIPVDAR